MIIRIWRGWTTPEDADAYEDLLRAEITPDAVNGASTPGMLGIDVLRHDSADEVEFSTIMSFTDWDAVRSFAGDDLDAAVVPEADRALLTRWDSRSRHYELLSRNGVPAEDLE